MCFWWGKKASMKGAGVRLFMSRAQNKTTYFLPLLVWPHILYLQTSPARIDGCTAGMRPGHPSALVVRLGKVGGHRKLSGQS